MLLGFLGFGKRVVAFAIQPFTQLFDQETLGLNNLKLFLLELALVVVSFSVAFALFVLDANADLERIVLFHFESDPRVQKEGV